MRKFYIPAIIIMLCACCENKHQKVKKEEPLISKKEVKLTSRLMTPETLWYFGRVGNTKVSPCEKYIAYTVTWYDIEQNKSNSDLYVMDVNGQNQKQLTKSHEREGGVQWRPDSEYIGFVRSGKIFEIKPDGTGEREVKSDIEDIMEFTYSPKGDKILFSKEVQVEKMLGKDIHPDMPLANVYTSDDLMYRHWDTWEDGIYSHIHVASYDNGALSNPKDIMPNEAWDAPVAPFDDISETSWSPDGKIIAYSCKKLKGKEYAEQTNSGIYLYNTETAETKLLTEGMQGYNKHPLFSPDGTKLLWLSMERPGFEADKERIFVHDFVKQTNVDVSKYHDMSPSSIIWSTDGKSIFFTACQNQIFNVYRLRYDGSMPENIEYEKAPDDYYFVDCLSKASFTNMCDYQNVQIAGDKFIVNRTDMTRPSEIHQIDRIGNDTQLSFVNKHVLDQLDLPSMEIRSVETTDKKNMLVWYVLPPNIDKNKKHPTVMMCTGGPQGPVSQSYSYRWNYALMASQGYVVVYPARRGVSGQGQQWCDEVSKDHGGQPERDLISAIDYAAKEPFVDKDRLGAVGASYGGFSVFWLAGNHNKRFKAFIAHCGIFDMKSMFATTEELFFENWETGGPFWDKNPATQKSYSQSPMNFVEKWDTPIMVIHGERDYRVPYTQGMAAFNLAKIRGVDARLMIFPEENHWVLRPQNAIVWQREFFTWLDKYLKK